MKNENARNRATDYGILSEEILADNDETRLFRIGEMARMFGVTLRALRFYEDKGLLEPKRSGSTRLYNNREIARLKLILLGRKVGFSLRDIKQLLDLYDPVGSNVRQLRLALDKSERQLERMKDRRDSIDEAIRELKEIISVVQGRLDGAKRKAS